MKNVTKLINYCELCVTKHCQVGCPLNNDIPGFIKYMKEKKYREAYEVLLNTTILMSACGRICPYESFCQHSCVKGISHESVKIGELETFIGDYALEHKWKIPVPKTTKYNVAIVGSGPAGLTCAYFLRKNGIGVTIYEKRDCLGGLLIHGIPDYRIDHNKVKGITKQIVDMGIKVHLESELGKDYMLDDLTKKHDAVFLAFGFKCGKKLGIPGEDKLGVFGAYELLNELICLNVKNKEVVIIGAGDVSIDAGVFLKRAHAKKVTIVYRRTKAEMPATKKNYEFAIKEGVEFAFSRNIVQVNGEDKVTGIEVIKTKIIKAKGNTPATVKNIEGSNYSIDCDFVVAAIGPEPGEFVHTLGLDLNPNNTIKVDRFGKTSMDKVFAGGDIANAQEKVVTAARSGRNVAFSIIDFLDVKNKNKR